MYFSLLCERGCLISETIPVNLSFQDVVFPCWIMTALKICLEFEENLQFRRQIKTYVQF